jgi:membrane-bound ClpP family serine protease
MGLEQAITRLNNEMAVLPLGLSLILGITTHLDIPTDLPLMMIAMGAVLVFVGGLMSKFGQLALLNRG